MNNQAYKRTIKDANQEDFETTAEAKSFLRARYQKYLQLEALTKLQFPPYRIVDDVTPDEQLGKYSFSLWEQVEQDIKDAIDDNSQTYEECEEKLI